MKIENLATAKNLFEKLDDINTLLFQVNCECPHRHSGILIYLDNNKSLTEKIKEIITEHMIVRKKDIEDQIKEL